MIAYALIAWLFSVGGVGGYAWYKGYSWGAEVIHDQKNIISRQRSQLDFWRRRDAHRIEQINGLDQDVAAYKKVCIANKIKQPKRVSTSKPRARPFWFF